MKIPNILQSIATKLESGAMTMREAQEILCDHGWFCYLPSENEVNNLIYKHGQ